MATTVFDKPVGTEIGQLSSLTTSNKTNLVNAINSLNSKIPPIVFSVEKTFSRNETQTITFPEKGVYLVTYAGNWANADCGAWIVFISAYDNAVTELKKNGCTFAITNNASMIGTFTYTHTSADSGTLKAIKI